jgi:hypothetical protein
MASPSEPLVRSFLLHSMIAQVATRSPKGHPFMTPLWFVVDGDLVFITTGAASQTGKNIMQHPEVALLFGGERDGSSDQLLRLRGTATCHRGLPSWRVLLRIAAKYYVSPSALTVELRNAGRWRLRQLYYGQQPGGVGYLRVVPTEAAFLPKP